MSRPRLVYYNDDHPFSSIILLLLLVSTFNSNWISHNVHFICIYQGESSRGYLNALISPSPAQSINKSIQLFQLSLLRLWPTSVTSVQHNPWSPGSTQLLHKDDDHLSLTIISKLIHVQKFSFFFVFRIPCIVYMYKGSRQKKPRYFMTSSQFHLLPTHPT